MRPREVKGLSQGHAHLTYEWSNGQRAQMICHVMCPVCWASRTEQQAGWSPASGSFLAKQGTEVIKDKTLAFGGMCIFWIVITSLFVLLLYGRAVHHSSGGLRLWKSQTWSCILLLSRTSHVFLGNWTNCCKPRLSNENNNRIMYAHIVHLA